MAYQVGSGCRALTVLIALQSRRSNASKRRCLTKTGKISSLPLGLITGRWRKREQSAAVQELSSFCVAGKTRGGWQYGTRHRGNQWTRRGARVFSRDGIKRKKYDITLLQHESSRVAGFLKSILMITSCQKGFHGKIILKLSPADIFFSKKLIFIKCSFWGRFFFFFFCQLLSIFLFFNPDKQKVYSGKYLFKSQWGMKNFTP